ncbi:hypothetical protein EJ04DRAFT_566033 [Polyplosphaeria fusca]|uniref:Uncharacterized protein n=1 Tax=Polyplosphaeria fusca TaxID=682080 RepID=A0A9P4V1I8_9PLEO|nr:hypothetical protein EJ04DRAFT_566033 [Polyplosphaeria fusca]
MSFRRFSELPAELRIRIAEYAASYPTDLDWVWKDSRKAEGWFPTLAKKNGGFEDIAPNALARTCDYFGEEFFALELKENTLNFGMDLEEAADDEEEVSIEATEQSSIKAIQQFVKKTPYTIHHYVKNVNIELWIKPMSEAYQDNMRVFKKIQRIINKLPRATVKVQASFLQLPDPDEDAAEFWAHAMVFVAEGNDLIMALKNLGEKGEKDENEDDEEDEDEDEDDEGEDEDEDDEEIDWERKWVVMPGTFHVDEENDGFEKLKKRMKNDLPKGTSEIILSWMENGL